MNGCLTVAIIELKITPPSILFNGGKTLFQQGGGNNSSGKHKVDGNNHSSPNHTPPPATTTSNQRSNQLKSFPGQGSQHFSENIDIGFCSNNITKDQVNGGNYLLLLQLLNTCCFL
jgi:hypothetical protein